jgi:hypothetical protein
LFGSGMVVVYSKAIRGQKGSLKRMMMIDPSE